MLFYAWARDQTGGASRHEFSAADVLVPWTAKSGDVYQRFCHVFEDGELEALVASVPGARVVRAYISEIRGILRRAGGDLMVRDELRLTI